MMEVMELTNDPQEQQQQIMIPPDGFVFPVQQQAPSAAGIIGGAFPTTSVMPMAHPPQQQPLDHLIPAHLLQQQGTYFFHHHHQLHNNNNGLPGFPPAVMVAHQQQLPTPPMQPLWTPPPPPQHAPHHPAMMMMQPLPPLSLQQQQQQQILTDMPQAVLPQPFILPPVPQQPAPPQHLLFPAPEPPPPTIPVVIAYTVQDRPLVPPVYNGVNPNYPGLRVLHQNPPLFIIDNFLSPLECEFLIAAGSDSFSPAPVVGKGAGEVSPSRTSSTCYLAREDLPDLMRKVEYLTGKPSDHCELPQVGRYLTTQQYLPHYDAFDLATDDGRRFAANGGQRTVTVLVYLNTVAVGGATRFPALDQLAVQPVAGMAVVFFPATIDGYLDRRAVHAAEPAVDVKYVSQIWIRQTNYVGQPSKRLPQTLGVPLSTQSHNETMMTTTTMTTTAAMTTLPPPPPQTSAGATSTTTLGLGQILPNTSFDQFA
jgi:prolyl 4-hydroxylase